MACLYDKEGMTKRFRPWDPKRKWLLPPEITEFIPEGHPAHFVRDLVVEELDLSAILDTYAEEKGFPPFHPAMMVALLLYAYTQGVFSSRKIAKAALEQEAIAKAKEEENKPQKKAKKKKDDDQDPPGPPETPKPEPKVQRNFTDPESRIMPTKNGFEQCYNAQAGVDAKAQVIVACEVVNTSADCPLLLPMVDQVRANLGRKPRACSADAGYFSEANLVGLEARRINAYVATGRQKHGSKAAAHAKYGQPGSIIARMRDKLKRGGWRSPYRLRKQVVEPVFGQIKQAMGFRQFLLRGLAKVKAEWQLVCTAHNLRKLASAIA